MVPSTLDPRQKDRLLRRGYPAWPHDRWGDPRQVSPVRGPPPCKQALSRNIFIACRCDDLQDLTSQSEKEENKVE